MGSEGSSTIYIAGMGAILLAIFFISIVVIVIVSIIRRTKRDQMKRQDSSLREHIYQQQTQNEELEKKPLCEVLKEYRVQNKMTQEFVAESLGVSRQAVSKWEMGASDPSTGNLLALAKLYQTSADELLKRVK